MWMAGGKRKVPAVLLLRSAMGCRAAELSLRLAQYSCPSLAPKKREVPAVETTLLVLADTLVGRGSLAVQKPASRGREAAQRPELRSSPSACCQEEEPAAQGSSSSRQHSRAGIRAESSQGKRYGRNGGLL
jgi:hypothetical protein